MTWLDTLLIRGNESKRELPREGTASRDAPVIAKPRAPRKPVEIKTVPVQTAAPFGSSPGAITVGSTPFRTALWHDPNCKRKRKWMPAGNEPRHVAYLITRESWKATAPDFNRALNYQPLGLA